MFIFVRGPIIRSCVNLTDFLDGFPQVPIARFFEVHLDSVVANERLFRNLHNVRDRHQPAREEPV